jgi:tRNA1(Val) A37 N6-methylase TrmN6
MPGHDGSSRKRARASISPDATTEDAILDGRVVVRQPRAGFRVAIDSVLLAASVPVRAGETVLEPGTGVGAAALCLLCRVPECHVVGLELQPDLADLARENAARNGRRGSFEVLVGDVARPPARITQGGFAHVMMNPPYLDPARSRAPRSSSRESSMVEGAVPLAGWIALALRALRPKGSLTLIHRADRLPDILAALDGKAGGIVVAPLWPESSGNQAIRVIVRARKGIATPFRLAAGLVLHERDGSYTLDANTVLRDARALEF